MTRLVHTYYGRNHLQVNSTNKLWLNFKLISFFCYPLMISSFKWFETQYFHSYLLLTYEISIKSIVSILILTYWYYLMINNNLFLVHINLQMILPYVHHWQFAPSIVMSEKKLCSSSCLVFSCCDSKWQAFINRIWASYLNKYNMMIEWWYTSNVK